jgi:hypothetical protein
LVTETKKMRDAHDDDEIVKDGESVRVPVYLMDATQRRFAAFDADAHRPHHAELTDEVRKLRAKTRAEYLAGLRDAWRTPHRDAAEPDSSSPPEVMRRHLEPDNAHARRNAAWAAYKDQLGRAWRTDLRRADVVEREREKWTHER